VFRRAAREIRVAGGLLLLVAAVAVGAWVANGVTRQADRDYALCGHVVMTTPDCVVTRRPVGVGWTESSSSGFRRGYVVSVQTSPSVTLSIGGLSEAEAGSFSRLGTAAELRYRQGRLVAILAPDGTSLKVPFAVTKRLLVDGSAALVLGLLGMGSMAWGLTRVNRTPRP
jgi:hypothetical protein